MCKLTRGMSSSTKIYFLAEALLFVPARSIQHLHFCSISPLAVPKLLIDKLGHSDQALTSKAIEMLHYTVY